MGEVPLPSFVMVNFDINDDELVRFRTEGALPLPAERTEGYVECDGALVWFASFGVGAPVFLLHGGMGNSGNWGFQVAALMEAGYQAVTIDTRGHGRSTRDDRPFSYDQMAKDVVAVMEALTIPKAALVGWSDGACTAMVLGATDPSRVSGVFFFACNMDPTGTKEITEFPVTMQNCFGRHTEDYRSLSPTPAQFERLPQDLEAMWKTQPNYSAEDLAKISVPVTIAYGANDEMITREHMVYLAATIPGARWVELPEVSHFAPLQRPSVFNQAVLDFLASLPS